MKQYTDTPIDKDRHLMTFECEDCDRVFFKERALIAHSQVHDE